MKKFGISVAASTAALGLSGGRLVVDAAAVDIETQQSETGHGCQNYQQLDLPRTSDLQ